MIKALLGVILAGGQARRLGGGDKALRELAGKPLLAHAIDRLAPQVSDIIINANGVVTYKHVGPITQDAMDNKILPKLREAAGG